MFMYSVSRNRSIRPISQHGCKIATAGTLGRFFRRHAVALVSLICFLGCASIAKAELKLYVSDSVGNSLEVFDNQGGDEDSRLGFIVVDPDSLSTAFRTGWTFGIFQAEDTLTENNIGQAVRRLNLQFDVINSEEGSTKSIEVKVLSTGFLNPLLQQNELSLFGVGTTTQDLSDGIPPPLDVRIAGAFNRDESGTYQTNDYDDLDGELVGPLWVLGAKGSDIGFTGIDGSGGSTFYVNEPYSTPFTPDGGYSITLSTFVADLGYNEQFGVQADLEFIVPEPASLVTWGLFATFLGGAAKRRRRPRNTF